MPTLPHLQHISELASLVKYHGIRHVVISPGSRNAPLMQLFTSDPDFVCHSIVDERSAGYVALGMTRELTEPVAVLSTSGTAVLNLAPAVAEASQQGLPLLVLTADRPREKLASFNNQRLDQQDPYGPFVKGVLQWPSGFNAEKDLREILKQAHRLLESSMHHPGGPVHMNFLLTDPLYEALPPSMNLWKRDQEVGGESGKPGKESHIPDKNLFSSGERLLILAGTGKGEEGIRDVLSKLLKETNSVVVAENISNLYHSSFISNPELTLAAAGKEDLERLKPQRILSFGGQVVSKRLKLILQDLEGVSYYQIPFGSEKEWINQLLEIQEIRRDNDFLMEWKAVEKVAFKEAVRKFASLPFSNLGAVHRLLKSVPAGTVVHLGNSASVRYSQLVPVRKDLKYFSNRGTSGIDGCLSTAVGAAMVSVRQHLLILGDLSFVYDSNALWNRNFPRNLKIIVINDRGGGIFRLLDGPSGMPFYEKFQLSSHPVNLEKLCAAFGIACLEAGSEEELVEKMEFFYSRRREPIVLEVDTSGSENSRIFKDFFRNKEKY